MRRRFLVVGRVQGVGFRAWAVRRARALGLRGTVCNRADGSVDVEVVGGTHAVQRFREVLARGPEPAIVRAVREEPPTDSALPDGFRIVG
jgi:acylphosphatase